jgi:hypothetical protein
MTLLVGGGVAGTGRRHCRPFLVLQVSYLLFLAFLPLNVVLHRIYPAPESVNLQLVLTDVVLHLFFASSGGGQSFQQHDWLVVRI